MEIKTVLLNIIFITCLVTTGKAQSQSLSLNEVKELSDILKNNTSLFCQQIDQLKINFILTSDVIKELRRIGAKKEMIECLKNNFTDNLKFHTIQFKCNQCDASLANELTHKTIKAMFHQKQINEAFERVGRKRIVETPKQSAEFGLLELPTIYLTGNIRIDQNNSHRIYMYLRYRDKYSAGSQEVISIGSQEIASKTFKMTGSDEGSIEEISQDIARWVLDSIESEVNIR